MGSRPARFWLGCVLLAGYACAAALAPWIAPYDPRLPSGRPLAAPGGGHVLGTNDLGQDLFSQLIHGARWTLVIAASVTALSTALSWLVGLTAGFFRRTESALMATADLLLALPNIPLYLLVLTLAGPNQRNLILVLAFLSWPAFARIVRGIVLHARSAPFVEASKALGGSSVWILRRYVLPATYAALPAKLVLTVRFAVFAETTLAFLGVSSGNVISWGMMLNWAFSDPLLFSRPVWPWFVFPPTVAIAGLILATVWISSGFIESRSGPVALDRVQPRRRARHPREPRADRVVLQRERHPAGSERIAGSPHALG